MNPDEAMRDDDKTKSEAQPLGKHRDPDEGLLVLEEFPTPQVFSESLKNSEPILMRNVLNDKTMPAFKLWTDEYIRGKFEEEMLEVEVGKKEDGEREMKQMKMEEFIDKYRENASHQVQNVPQSMKGDVLLPRSIQCGGYRMQLVTMSLSGGGKGFLLQDPLENINCLLDGQKEFVLIDKKDKDLVEADGWQVMLSYSNVDPDSVDMTQYPMFSIVPWKSVTLRAGDCVYIPFKWYHQVNSAPGRNLAIHFWFHHMTKLNTSDCEKFEEEKKEKVSVESVTLSPEQEEERVLFLEIFEKLDNISIQTFQESLQEKITSLKEIDYLLEQLFNYIDKDASGTLTFEELYGFNITEAISKYVEVFNRISMHIAGIPDEIVGDYEGRGVFVDPDLDSSPKEAENEDEDEDDVDLSKDDEMHKRVNEDDLLDMSFEKISGYKRDPVTGDIDLGDADFRDMLKGMEDNVDWDEVFKNKPDEEYPEVDEKDDGSEKDDEEDNYDNDGLFKQDTEKHAEHEEL